MNSHDVVGLQQVSLVLNCRKQVILGTIIMTFSDLCLIEGSAVAEARGVQCMGLLNAICEQVGFHM